MGCGRRGSGLESGQRDCAFRREIGRGRGRSELGREERGKSWNERRSGFGDDDGELSIFSGMLEEGFDGFGVSKGDDDLAGVGEGWKTRVRERVSERADASSSFSLLAQKLTSNGYDFQLPWRRYLLPT